MKIVTKLGFIASTLISCVATAIATPLDAADPAHAQSPIPSVQYRSPFRDYRPLGEDKPIPWKAANDEVGRIGGWRVYAREARQPDMATTPLATVPKPPAEGAAPKTSGAHAGHGPQK